MKIAKLNITINRYDGSDVTSELLDTLLDRVMDMVEGLDCQCFAMGKLAEDKIEATAAQEAPGQPH